MTLLGVEIETTLRTRNNRAQSELKKMPQLAVVEDHELVLLYTFMPPHLPA
jgi:hypothetical protein